MLQSAHQPVSLAYLLGDKRMDLVHGILYHIARTVVYGINITSAHFLANMDDPRFTKSRSRWDSFAEAVDSEVSAPLHAFSVFVLCQNVGRFAIVSRPGGLDLLSSPPGHETIAMRPTF